MMYCFAILSTIFTTAANTYTYLLIGKRLLSTEYFYTLLLLLI